MSSMAAGTSVIQRGMSLSTLSISHPAVINSRPFSHRIQSAHLLVPQSQLFEVDRSFTTRSHKFPHADATGVSPVAVETALLHDEDPRQWTKSSTFANFRLLQRLSFSAKARVSCGAEEFYSQDPTNNLTSEGDINKNYYPGGTFETDSTVGNALSVHPPSLKDPEQNVSGKKSQKQKTKKSPKKIKPSHVGGSEQPASVNHLRLTSSKVIPTSSKRFDRHRKTHNRKKNSVERFAYSFPGESGTSCNSFNGGTIPGGLRIPEKSLASDNHVAGLGCSNTSGESSTNIRDSIQEASLRAIYESCNNPPSILSEPSKEVRLKKLFQSEKQSGSITECGRLFPCAPPATPTPLLLEKYEIIPSLADFRSQQSIKQRLKALEKDAKKKESIKEKQKKQQELETLQTRQEEQRIRTRQEIYALNKIMTKLERDHFKKFQERMKNS